MRTHTCHTSGILHSHASHLTTQCVPFSPTVGLMSAGQLGVFILGKRSRCSGCTLPCRALFTCFIRNLQTDAAARQQMLLYSCSPVRVVISLQSAKGVKLRTLKKTFNVHHIKIAGDQFFTVPQRNCLKYDLSFPPSRRRPSSPPPRCHSWLLRLSTVVISL